MRTTALLLFPLFIATASAQVGIASHYPGDRGINYDADVLFADDFESYTSPAQLTSKWSGAGPQQNLRIATEPGNYYADGKALEMKLPISSSEVLDHCYKVINPAQNVIFFRAYTKFDDNFSITTSSHNGLRVSARYPGGAGVAPPQDGSGWFMFSLQNNKARGTRHYPNELQPGYGQIYAYWPKQRDNYGDHWFSDGWVRPGGNGLWLLSPVQYPDFQPMPVWQPQGGKWYCYELMVKANTIGRADGEVAFWIDGKLSGRFPDLFLRSLDSIKIDYARLTLHALHSEQVNKKWYDNVVIAKKYIGPMTPLRH
jgi:hypothetical protein